jgi:hypothetical protein
MVLVLVLFSLVSSSYAQGGAGVRAGASIDPDQFYFGGHVEVGPVIERLWFRPNVEIGLGDDRTLVGLNGEFAYWFPLTNPDWDLYVGAGPAVNIIRFEAGPLGQDETDVEGGFNILLGLSHREGLFTELKIGAIQSPEVKFGIGFTFR